MHDQAELVRGSGILGRPGDGVTIDEVEAAYASSSTANSAEEFRCSGCGVRVIAVITDPTRRGRKKSPSSYFRATPVSHKSSCRPQATLSTPTTAPTPPTKPANPNKATRPTAWDDAPDIGAGISTNGSTSSVWGTGPGAGTRTSTVGSGTSRSKSRRVERFAAEWKTMSSSARAVTELRASWNPGGTYGSAFLDLSTTSLADESPTRTAIYCGTIASIWKGKTGYILTLAERHMNGSELCVWVQNHVSASDPSGKRLWANLVAGTVQPGSLVFALGEFAINHRPTTSWYSLPVASGNHIWVS